MILVPQRLLDQPFMSQILSDGHSYILRKKLPESLTNRESYISKSVLSIVLHGCQQITNYEGELTRVMAGDMVFMPKGLYNISDLFIDDQGFESVLFFFDESIIEEFLLGKDIQEASTSKGKGIFRFKENSGVKAYLEAVKTIVPKMNMIQKAFVEVKMQELLYLLEAQDENFTSFLRQAVQGTTRNIKTFMETNYDKPLKVEDYAYLTGKSISTFRREFKTRFATTPQKWLMEKRLEKAHHLLINTPTSVTQVAYETGYENVSHFIKEFKKKYALTPKQLLVAYHERLSI